MGSLSIGETRLERIRNFEQEGKLILRVSLFLTYTTNCGEILSDWYKDHPRTDVWGERLRIGGVKIFTDGGSCGECAVSFEYVTGGCGDLFFTQEALNDILTDIHNAGFPVAFHAQGDRAVETCMNAIEYVLNGQPNTLRHRIDHNAYIRPDMVSRYTEIGISPVIFGEFFTCSEEGIIAYIGTEPLSFHENWHDLLEANPDLPIGWHSDAPWLKLDPFYNLYSYVTRKEIAEDGTVCKPSPWLEAHKITIEQALPLMTTGAAYTLFREDEVGSLVAGNLADLIIISDNPLAVDPDSLANIHVLMTMIDGKVEYCRPGNENLCLGFSNTSSKTINKIQGFIRNRPNPATGHATIQVFLEEKRAGKIVLYDIAGQEIETISQGVFSTGMRDPLPGGGIDKRPIHRSIPIGGGGYGGEDGCFVRGL